jgi:cytochrome c oxidase subunit I+III
VVFLLVDGALFASLVFSYLFLWTVNPASWPPEDVEIPPLLWPAVAAIVLAGSGAAMAYANRALGVESQRDPWVMRIALMVATLVMVASLWIAFHDLWQTALRPHQHAYGAMVYTTLGYQGLHVAVLLVMACYLLARSAHGLLDAVRRASFDNTRLLWYYTVGQGLVALATIHLFPRLIH